MCGQKTQPVGKREPVPQHGQSPRPCSPRELRCHRGIFVVFGPLGMTTGSYYASFSGFSQQSPKGDNRRHAGAVQEQEGGQTLEAQRVLEITPVPGRLPLDVQHQAPKQPAETGQTGLKGSPCSAGARQARQARQAHRMAFRRTGERFSSQLFGIGTDAFTIKGGHTAEQNVYAALRGCAN